MNYDFLLNAISVARKSHAKNMTLGKMLSRLEQFPKRSIITVDNHGMDKYKEAMIELYHDEPEYIKKLEKEGDFFDMFLCDNWDSYRGYYEDMYIGITNVKSDFTVGELIELLKRAKGVGKMWGYKGGEYTVDDNTLVWLEKEKNEAKGIAPVALYKGDNSNVILVTEYLE